MDVQRWWNTFWLIPIVLIWTSTSQAVVSFIRKGSGVYSVVDPVTEAASTLVSAQPSLRERERKCAANCNLPLHGSVIWFTHLSLPWLRVGWLISSLIPINDAHCTSSSSDDHKDCFPPQKALACSRSSGCFDHKPGIMGVFFLIGRPDLKVFFSHRSIFFLCVYPAIHMQRIYYRSNQRWNSGEHERQFIHNLRPAVLRVNSLQLNSVHITAGACSTFGILHATKLLPLVGRGLWSPPCTCRISVWTVEQAVQLRGSP